MATAEKIYRGERFANGTVSVTGDGAELSPAASQRVRNHSPDGFNWGYRGSGPAQLALALLLDVTGDPDVADGHYQRFKEAFVSTWLGDTWTVTAAEIREWLAARVTRHDGEGG